MSQFTVLGIIKKARNGEFIFINYSNRRSKYNYKF